MVDSNCRNQDGSLYTVSESGCADNTTELDAFLDNGLCENKRCRFNLASKSKFVVYPDIMAFECVLNVRHIDKNGKCTLAEYEEERYPESTNDREEIVRLVCMVDDLAASIMQATHELDELRTTLGKLLQEKVRYPDSCFAEPPPVKSRIPLPDDDDLLAFRQYAGD